MDAGVATSLSSGAWLYSLAVVLVIVANVQIRSETKVLKLPGSRTCGGCCKAVDNGVLGGAIAPTKFLGNNLAMQMS